MKRSVVAAAMVGALAFIPGAGHASSVQAGTCSVNGLVTFTNRGEGQWQSTSADTVSRNAGAGEFLFTVDDPTACAGDGVTTANVASQVVFGFAADPQAAE